MNFPPGFVARCFVRVVATGLLSLGFGWAGASDSGSGSAIGRVSLLIGTASVVHADGTREALARASAIRVGDRIETAANGHVHVRFVDNAAISVRPDSTLEVQAYRYDVLQPQNNEVRLRMDQGISRSISGSATDLDKSRFRLNTPIAAIGVRGTDFVIQTDALGVRATVADGAIVVGAFGATCQPSGLGPCAGSGVRVLTSDMGGMMAEVRPGELTARLVPAIGYANAVASAQTDRNSSERMAQLSAARAAGLVAAEPTPSESLKGNDRAAADLLTLVSVQVPVLNRALDVSDKSLDLAAQLIWGRWSIGAVEGDKLSVPFSLARQGRHVTVADKDMGLFRTDQTATGAPLFDSLSASVQFNLTRASATFETGDKSEPAAIDAGNLTIDFARRTFATGLDLSTASGLKGEFRMAGAVRADGLFAIKETDQRIAGAISLDAKEVGYLFERSAVGGGMFRGRTLWGN